MKQLLASALLAASLFACTKNPAPVPAPPAVSVEAKAPLAKKSLETYLPAPGIQWLVQLRPRELATHPELRRDWSPVISGERLRAFEETSGLQAKAVEELWIAGYQLGTLLLYDARKVGNEAEKRFLARALTSSEVETGFEELSYFTAMMDGRPHALVHHRGHFIAVADGDLSLAKIVLAYAQGRLKKSPPALQTRFATPLADFGAEAPARAFLFGPFEEASDAVSHSLLTLALSLRLEGPLLKTESKALGLWRVQDAPALSEWLHQIIATPELRALGLGSPRTMSEVLCALPTDNELKEKELSLCSFSADFDSGKMASALHRITSGDMKEITHLRD